jgi:hypothetical protein
VLCAPAEGLRQQVFPPVRQERRRTEWTGAYDHSALIEDAYHADSLFGAVALVRERDGVREVLRGDGAWRASTSTVPGTVSRFLRRRVFVRPLPPDRPRRSRRPHGEVRTAALLPRGHRIRGTVAPGRRGVRGRRNRDRVHARPGVGAVGPAFAGGRTRRARCAQRAVRRPRPLGTLVPAGRHRAGQVPPTRTCQSTSPRRRSSCGRRTDPARVHPRT